MPATHAQLNLSRRRRLAFLVALLAASTLPQAHARAEEPDNGSGNASENAKADAQVNAKVDAQVDAQVDANRGDPQPTTLEPQPHQHSKLQILAPMIATESSVVVIKKGVQQLDQVSEFERAEAEQAAAERAAAEQAAREQAARDQVVREQAAREQAARDQAAREQAARDLAAREQAARDLAAREQTSRELARELARDQAAREQAARENAVWENTTTQEEPQSRPPITPRSADTVNTHEATYRGANSTLEMQPVAGPLFGRKGQPFFRFGSRNQETKPPSRQRTAQPRRPYPSSAVPRPPAYYPPTASYPPSTTVPRARVSTAPSTRNSFRHTQTDGWIQRSETSSELALRDPNPSDLRTGSMQPSDSWSAPRNDRSLVAPSPSNQVTTQQVPPRERLIDQRYLTPSTVRQPLVPSGPIASTLRLKPRQPPTDPPSLAPRQNSVPMTVEPTAPSNSVLRLRQKTQPTWDEAYRTPAPDPKLVVEAEPEPVEPELVERSIMQREPAKLTPVDKKVAESITLTPPRQQIAEDNEADSMPKRVPAADVVLRENNSHAADDQASIRESLIEEAQRKRKLQQESVRQEPASPRVAARSTDRDDTGRSRVGDLNDSQSLPVTLDYVGMPAQKIQISPYVQRMKPGISRALQYFYDRPEKAPGRSNWGMMHAIMVYGIDTRCAVGDRNYSTIAWIAGNNICRGQRLTTQQGGRIKVKSGVGLQGHQAQMLAVFSLCDVPSNYPIYADNVRFTMADVIEEEKLACKSGEELTFTLIGLSHYLDTDASWIARDGQRWDFERLIREELSQPIVGAACGGTHRLMGYAHALRNRRAEGKPMTGQWARAERYIHDFVNYTYSLQNRDGSMSTNWYEGRGDNGDVDRKIQTTGHMVEFLLTATPDSQLQDPRLVRAIAFLNNALNRNLGHDWKIGPKGHALRSLAMYHDRIFKSGPAYRRQSMAQSTRSIYR